MQLNCDLGEKIHDNDALIMPYINMANIACGFHASDPLTIANTIKLALTHNVSIGAHPSYNDKINFGRISIDHSPEELIALIQYQIGALHALCVSNNGVLAYVKPHGALYNDMMKNPLIFETVCQAIAKFDATRLLLIQALPDSTLFKKIAKKNGITLMFEAFADREYTDEGLLVSRKIDHSVIHDPNKIIQRCNQLLNNNKITSINGKTLTLEVDTLCVHGDNPAAIKVVKTLYELLYK